MLKHTVSYLQSEGTVAQMAETYALFVGKSPVRSLTSPIKSSRYWKDLFLPENLESVIGQRWQY